MKNTKTKQTLLWTAITVLSIGAASGCEYCIPVMLTLLTSYFIYRLAGAVLESLRIQAFN